MSNMTVFFKTTPGAGDMAYGAKCLPHKREDLSPHKQPGTAVCVCDISAGEWRQARFRFSEKPCLK